ncbi:hypothetical protein ABK040_016285 [Willaertia magna]
MPATRSKNSSTKRKRYKEEESDDNDSNYESDESLEETSSSLESDLGEWKTTDDGKCLYFIHKNFPSIKFDENNKSIGIASYDLDSTLIVTKSGKKFATSSSDWKVFNSNVGTKLKKEHTENKRLLIIFSNQNGVAKGKLTKEEVKERVEGFIKEAIGTDIPILFFGATHEDHYRKPNKGMYELFINEILPQYHKDAITIDKSKSFYIGDAAGRPERKDGKKKIKKDHSCGDRKFALNVGIAFHTPENYFSGEPEIAEFSWDGLNVKERFNDNKVLKEYTLEELGISKDATEIVVFQGFPASGKSTFAKKYFIPNGYVHINRDTLKTAKKCIDVCKDAVKKGKSCVVDNTNPDKASRKAYIDIAKEFGFKCRCFAFQVDLELAQHLNLLREKKTKGEHAHVPSVAYNKYKKSLEEPKKGEGFDEVKQINFIPSFTTDQEREEFMEYT